MPPIVVGTEDTVALLMKVIIHFVNDYANICILFSRMLKVDLSFTRKM